MYSVGPWLPAVGSEHPPHFLKGCGELGAGEGSRERVVADGHRLLHILHADLAMGKGPYHEHNGLATRHQLSHITGDWDRKRSANLHTANWEMVRHWILDYLQKLLRAISCSNTQFV